MEMNENKQTDDQDAAAIANVLAILGALGTDEVRVLLRIARRLAAGRRSYGLLDIARDPRDFQREAREELEDFLVYTACAWLKEVPR
jgi:hypothetical protein